MYGSKDHYTSSLKSEQQSIFSAVHFFMVNTDSTKLQFDSLFWQNAEKNSTSVSFSIRYKYITFPIHSNSVRLGMDVLQKPVTNAIISILRWKGGEKLVFCTRNPGWILVRASALDPRHIIPKEEKPRTEGNEDICIISNSPSSTIDLFIYLFI